jgi:pimeloyl-ACP methyl ester carboxylesterase
MMRWLRRIVLGVISLAALVVVVGATFEALARANAPKVFPAPGRLVDIGGRRIQLDCRGAGTPVVVFESGLDPLGSLSWARVQPDIARTTRACAYSRAGLMWSEPSGRPFSSANVADDLHKALAVAGEAPPYVLVAHSLGGPYALTFTQRYGADVAGLVFVDASHPDQLARLYDAIGREPDRGDGLVRTARTLAWTGLVRLIVMNGANVPQHAGGEVTGPYVAWFPQSLPAMAAESDALSDTLAAAGKSRRLGDRPLAVLTHGAPTPPAVLKSMKVTAAESARLDAAWIAMQDDEATWSSRSRHSIVPGATHYIQFDQPQAVTAAVLDVVRQVRSGPVSAKVATTPAPPSR